MSSPAAEPIVVVMTAADEAEAGRIAELLVESRLAACVQVLPKIESIYRWEGRVTKATEVLLLAKSTKAQFGGLVDRVTAVHSYDTPEIIALPVTAAAEPYLKWLLGSLPEGS